MYFLASFYEFLEKIGFSQKIFSKIKQSPLFYVILIYLIILQDIDYKLFRQWHSLRKT